MNGSHASATPAQPSPAHKASPSDTDVFLAIAAQSGYTSAQASNQPSLTPAASPVGSVSSVPRQDASPYAAHSSASRQGTAPRTGVTMSTPMPNAPTAAQTQQAQRQAKPASGPVNPLVAARNSGPSVTRPGGDPQESGLFPIQDVDPTAKGRGFDTTFAEKEHKHTALIVILIVILVAAVFVGAFFGVRYKQAQDARTMIDDAIELIRDTDDVIVPLDAAISSEITNGVASDTLSTVMLQSTSTSTNLSSADQLAVNAAKSSGVLSDEENAAIDAVKSSVSARRSMLEVGRMLLSTDTNAQSALENLAQAYACIEDANAKIASSSEQSGSYWTALTTAGVDMSGYDANTFLSLDNEAIADITTAQSWVASAKEAFPDADLSVLDAYLEARLNELNILLQVDTFIANGDTASAESVTSDQLNPATEAANAAYASVPATAAELLTSAYSSATADERATYEDVRADCVAADAVLNDYLGITDASKQIGVTGSSASTTSATAVTAEVADAPAADAAADAASTDAGADAAADAAAEGADAAVDAGADASTEGTEATAGEEAAAAA